eukprot:TRINITY_DN1504_c0_g2_i2.p1 TRINITY_DN1504_c0_g2~~TRINITY_DN1504_c0_g2_i2.p1  ORF type:complete len:1151 (+),score=396.77 TRINITY_DN1504_c0_g2_i2:331-3453(+)
MSNAERNRNFAMFGKNEIAVPKVSALSASMDEVLQPFFLFQFFSVSLWLFEGYTWYASFIAIAALGSVAAKAYTVISNSNKLREMAEQTGTSSIIDCQALSEAIHSRNSSKEGSDTTGEDILRKPQTKSSSSALVDLDHGGLFAQLEQPFSFSSLFPGGSESIPTKIISIAALVPGDIVMIQSGEIVPCDMIVLSGNIIVNEASLTGESTPSIKVPFVPKDGEIYNPAIHSRHTLYSGTFIQSVKKENQHNCIAMVSSTGFSTAKGNLIRDLLYPSAAKQTFQQDAIKFVGIFAIIATIGSIYAYFIWRNHGSSILFSLIKGLDLITIIVPPALPLALSTAILSSLKTLSQKKIFCTNPSLVAECGKVDVAVFDKTGTLTEEGLNVTGICENLTQLSLNQEVSSLSKETLAVLSNCHSLNVLNNELIGDPLDLVMFKFSKHIFSEIIQPGGGIALNVRPIEGLEGNSLDSNGFVMKKRYEFSSDLQRQTAVVEGKSSHQLYVFTKGAPEVISQLLSSPNPEIEKAKNHFASSGYRVIALAWKEISPETFGENTKQEELETNMNFCGLLVLINPLKQDTEGTIEELLSAGIPCKMATGDDILTAISASRSCGILEKSTPYYTITFSKKDEKLVIEKSSDELPSLDTHSLIPLDSSSLSLMRQTSYPYAVHGDALEELWKKHGSKSEIMFNVVENGMVFARMKPEHKRLLVETLENAGFTTLACGDGANDCSALREAHVGLSIADTEASIAAPFTSSVKSITSVVSLLKEGRCTLSTSFSLFKYMCMYSTLQFVSVLLLYSMHCNFGDWQFFYIDMFLVIPLTWALSIVPASSELTRDTPPSDLMSFRVLLSLVTQGVVQAVSLSCVYLWISGMSWFVPPNAPPGQTSIKNHATAVVFLFSTFQYIGLCLAFSVNDPFRESPFNSFKYVYILITSLLSDLFILFQTSVRISSNLSLPVSIPGKFSSPPPFPISVKNLIAIFGICVIPAALIAEIAASSSVNERKESHEKMALQKKKKRSANSESITNKNEIALNEDGYQMVK